MKHKDPAAVALGRKGGKVKSEAKAAAARENGKRPKRKKLEKTMKVVAIVCLVMWLTGCASPLAPSTTTGDNAASLTVIVETASSAPLLITVAANAWLGPPIYVSQLATAFQPIRVTLSVPQTLYVSVEATEYGGAAGKRIVFDGDQTITLSF